MPGLLLLGVCVWMCAHACTSWKMGRTALTQRDRSILILMLSIDCTVELKNEEH